MTQTRIINIRSGECYDAAGNWRDGYVYIAKESLEPFEPIFLNRVMDAKSYLEEKHRRDIEALNRTIEILKEMEAA